jgi:hypothetical protein
MPVPAPQPHSQYQWVLWLGGGTDTLHGGAASMVMEDASLVHVDDNCTITFLLRLEDAYYVSADMVGCRRKLFDGTASHS